MTEDNAKLQKQVNDHNTKLQKQVDDLSEKMTEDNAKLQKQVDELSEKMSRMCEMQIEVMMKVTQMMTEVKQLKQMIPGQQLVRKSIIIAGGENKNSINSVEIFSWENKTWTLLNPMSTCRSRASAVTYQGEVIISAGTDGKKSTDTMETSSCDASVEWKISPVKLSELCRGHAAIMYKDSLILSGGIASKTSDKIYKISMVPPYSTKILATMPEPRYDHTMELFEDKLFIFGGCYEGAKDTVMMYNLVTKEWKMMTPLPFAVDEMATVLWQNNVIVLGGRNNFTGCKDTVVMYNLTTGESKYLPSMKHKRRGCAAVVTGGVLVVMGGEHVKSAEAFHFQEQVWEELPDMNEARKYASAVVKPN
ncbi:Influenza virus NS1A-binding [Paramuricea clavata]|nr:Influenza virus NS1A-binding [Paramuricea clavata]